MNFVPISISQCIRKRVQLTARHLVGNIALSILPASCLARLILTTRKQNDVMKSFLPLKKSLIIE